jgi:L-ascorbate metabolism protein UlaG (beta-lactamase superfamily)
MYRKPHQHRGRYFNLHTESLKTRFKELFKTIFLLAKHVIVKPERHDKKAAHTAWHTTPNFVETSVAPHITWLGHASFLIQLDGKNILTDPVFNEIARITPRYVDAVVAPHHLPMIDAVIISHNHRDHLDHTTVLALKNRVHHWFVPVGDKAWFTKRGIHAVTEITWWETATVGDVTLSFLPAHHWSGRHIIDMNESLWGSWMIQSPQKTIYFAGDTAYSEHFSLIGQAFKNIDIALMPIGPNEPYTMRETHVSACEAVQGFLDLGADCFVPMHWGTFKLGADTFNMPIEQLASAWAVYAKQLADKQLVVLKHGEAMEQDGTARSGFAQELSVKSEKTNEIT